MTEFSVKKQPKDKKWHDLYKILDRVIDPEECSIEPYDGKLVEVDIKWFCLPPIGRELSDDLEWCFDTIGDRYDIKCAKSDLGRLLEGMSDHGLEVDNIEEDDDHQIVSVKKYDKTEDAPLHVSITKDRKPRPYFSNMLPLSSDRTHLMPSIWTDGLSKEGFVVLEYGYHEDNHEFVVRYRK